MVGCQAVYQSGGEPGLPLGDNMSKAENLILLINLLYRRRAVDIKTMMKECDVTERTAYRYVRSLETAGFPVYFDEEAEGYRLMDKNSSFSRLSPEETAAILFALEFLECSIAPDSLGPIHRARTKLQLHLSGEIPEFLVDTLTAISASGKMSAIKEMLILALVRFACNLKKSIRIYHQGRNESSILTEIRSPKLVYDKEWKVNDESVGNRLGHIPVRQVINIEVV
jgi:predicted DNA-binding transcriptional regulator YafY